MTAPLTPADCDLRGLPFMPLDVVRLADSDLAALSTGEEFKAAVLLWCKSWLQIPAASLPEDDRILAHLTGTGPRWKKLKAIALKGWVKCDDGRLYHPVVADKANDAWERRGEWQERQSNKNERQQRWRDHVRTVSAELRELGVTPPAGASIKELERLLVDARASTGASTVDAGEASLTGTGTGTVEEKALPPKSNTSRKTVTTSGDAAPLAFEGKIIRLTKADFAQWERAYPLVDLPAALQSRDDWLASDDADDRSKKRWFLSTSNHLANLQQRAKGEQRETVAAGGWDGMP